MTKPIIFAVSAIALALFAGYFVIQPTHQPEALASTVVAEQGGDNNKLGNNAEQNTLAKKVLKNEQTLSLESTKMSNQEVFEHEGNAHQQVLENDVNTRFVKNKGDQEVIKQSAISDAFKADGFEKLLANLAMAEVTDLSINREQKLIAKVASIDSVKIVDSTVKCAGRICALQLTANEMSDVTQEEIDSFSKNYIFTNVSKNEYGDVLLRTIYIATDDPSSMVLDIN